MVALSHALEAGAKCKRGRPYPPRRGEGPRRLPLAGDQKIGRAGDDPRGIRPYRESQKSFVKEMPMANGNVITTHGLTKRYGPTITAVDPLALDAHRRQLFGFLGPTCA